MCVAAAAAAAVDYVSLFDRHNSCVSTRSCFVVVLIVVLVGVFVGVVVVIGALVGVFFRLLPSLGFSLGLSSGCCWGFRLGMCVDTIMRLVFQ